MEQGIKNTGILIVDDSNTVRKALESVLLKNGFQTIFSAENGKDALEKIKGNSEISFCILDLEMPVMNGFDFLVAMNEKGECRKVPTIVFTSLETPQNIVKALKLGAADYLHKKYSSEELVARISAQLRNIHLVREKESLELQINLKDEVMKLEQMKANFIDTLTHELKTPLTNIFGLTSLLKSSLKDRLTDKEQEYFDDVESESEALNDTISKLIEINHLVHNAIDSSKMEEFSLNSLLKELLPILNNSIGEKKIEISVNFNEDANTVYSSRESLKKVLLEGGLNAIKFTKRRGEITFTSKQEEGKVTIQIADNGIGIEDEKKETVFDLFYQVDDSSTRKFGGTGAGLYLCKKILEPLDGDIWFSDNDPKGSILNISIVNNKQ